MKRAFAGLAILLTLSLTVAPLAVGAEAEVVYRRTSTDGVKRIALTFDDGPHPRYTPEILEILAEYGVKATFFVVGSNAEYYPKLIARELQEGHEIGNHTYHHYHTAKTNAVALKRDMAACSEVLLRQTGRPVRLFRPPEGVFNEEIKTFCAENGYTIVMWSIDTRDWAHTPICEIVKNVREHARDGAIILMHDFIGKNSPTPAALRQIIPMLQELGFEFVTVSRLLQG